MIANTLVQPCRQASPYACTIAYLTYYIHLRVDQKALVLLVAANCSSSPYAATPVGRSSLRSHLRRCICLRKGYSLPSRNDLTDFSQHFLRQLRLALGL